jgi:hypothetical protein
MRCKPAGIAIVAVVLALNLLGGSATAAAKAPKPTDVAAARTVVHAISRFDETALHREGAMSAAAKALVAQVQAGCPGGIPSTVINGTSQEQAVAFDLVFEAAFDLSLDVVVPVRQPGLALAKGLDRVHFSTAAFTRGIHGTAKIQRNLLALTPSDLCGDVKAAAANSFTADPPGTTAFLAAFQKALTPPSTKITNVLKKLSGYLTSARDRAALKHLQKVDARYQTFATNLGAKWGAKLGDILAPTSSGSGGGSGGGFPPPPTTGSVRRAAMTDAFAAI